MSNNPSPKRVTARQSGQPWYRRKTTVAASALTAVLAIIVAITNSPQPATTNQLSPTTSLSTASASPTASASIDSVLVVPTAVASAIASAPPTSAKPAAVAPPPAPVASTHAVRTTKAAAPPASTKAAPPPAPSTCGAPKNPYGYNFCHVGHTITSPHSGVCDYFNCIANFWNGRGYMVECVDATYSMSGGISGACSHHGGVRQTVYSG